MIIIPPEEIDEFLTNESRLVGGRGSGFPSLQRREERTPLLSLSSKIRLMIVS